MHPGPTTEDDEQASLIAQSQKPPCEYEEALSLAKRTAMHFFVAGIAFEFFHASRMAVYVLYAQEFKPENWQIGLLLYCCRFWNGLAAILYGSIANQLGFDKTCLVLLALQCVAVLIETLASNFYMLFVGIMMAQVALTFLVFAYLAWILPEKVAKQYASYFYVLSAVSFLLGPITAGIISFYISYRMLFAFNLLVCIATLLFAFFFVLGKQTVLESKQLEVGLVAARNTDEQFPICLERCQNKLDNEHDGDDRTRGKWYSWPVMSCSDTILLLCVVYNVATVVIAENCISLYYTVYVINVMGGNVLLGTTGILLMAVGFIVGNVAAEKYLDNAYKLASLIIALSMMALHAVFLFPAVHALNVYFVLALILGIFFGAYSMISEMLLLEIQPAKHSGKINGLRGLIANWTSAFALLAISLWVDTLDAAVFYVMGMVFASAIFAAAVMAVVKLFKAPETAQISDIRRL